MLQLLLLHFTLLLIILIIEGEKRLYSPITVNDALEEVAQSQNYISSAVNIELSRIQAALNELEKNASDLMDQSEIALTMTTVNCTKKINLLKKFAIFLEIDVTDCTIDVESSLVNLQRNGLDRFKQCVLAVTDETNEFVKDTISQLKNYYFLTFTIANNIQACTDEKCIDSQLSPLTQLANDGMIAINSVSGNTIDLIYQMARSFKQCFMEHIQLGMAKVDALANAVATCINDKVSSTN